MAHRRLARLACGAKVTPVCCSSLTYAAADERFQISSVSARQQFVASEDRERFTFGPAAALWFQAAVSYDSRYAMNEATSGQSGIWYWWLAAVYGASCVVGLLLVVAPFSPVMAA